MLYALNDLLASFVFIDYIIVWIFMLKCVLRVRIKIYIYIYVYYKHLFIKDLHRWSYAIDTIIVLMYSPWHHILIYFIIKNYYLLY